MSYSISINEKHKYKNTTVKTVATGNSGGGESGGTEVTSIDFSGTTFYLKQYGLPDLSTELEVENIPQLPISKIDDLQTELDDSVSYTKDQTSKSEIEKQQARTNIDVYSIPQIDTITGDLDNLNTATKVNLVSGINQANSWKSIEW